MIKDNSYEVITSRDAEYVTAYLKYHSQIKAAEECGVGRTTIARAVTKAGIELDGQRMPGNHGGGSTPKISDEELVKEAEYMTRKEIAIKHGMHITNVDKKLKRLGIKCKSARVKEQSDHR